MYPNILYWNSETGLSFSYGSPIVTSYGLMLMLAFLICNYLLKKQIVKKGLNQKIADDIVFYAALGGIVGSKIYYAIEEGTGVLVQFNSLYNLVVGLFTLNGELIRESVNLLGGGLTFLGGLIGGTIFVSLYIIWKKFNWLEIGDLVAPFLILGHAIGRIGCFLVGDCYGKISNLPWAVSFPDGSPSTINAYGELFYVHPTQIYEVITGILIYIYLCYLRDKTKYFKGQIFLEYLFLAGLARFLVEFLRINPRYLTDTIDLSGSQFISIFMILISSALMYTFRKKNTLYNGIN